LAFGRSFGAGLDSAGTLKHPHYRAPLLALGAFAPGAVRARRARNLDRIRFRDHGYTRGTRRDHSPQLIECRFFRVAEGEGFEPPVRFPVQWFSRPPVSTAHASLRTIIIE